MKVLIFEINPYHYEVIPGFVSLFLDLGYQVDCLLQDTGAYGDVFCRCEEMRKRIRVFNYTSETVLDKLQELQNNYDIVFFSSIDIRLETTRQAAQLLKQNNTKIAGCCHAFCFPDEMIRNTLQYFDGRIVTLSETTTPYGHFSEVNANRFCDHEKESNKHEKSSVIGIGVTNDHYELVKAADLFYKKTGNTVHVTLVRPRYEFIYLIKYCVIRFFRLNKHDWKRYRPIVGINRRETEVTGRIPFPELFSRIDDSDFIAINMYERAVGEFSSERTTGARQLSLGFLKPCIIEKELADYYGFDETNAVIYSKGEFVDALERAVSMTEEEYADMVRELKKLRDRIREKTLKNLRKVLWGIY